MGENKDIYFWKKKLAFILCHEKLTAPTTFPFVIYGYWVSENCGCGLVGEEEEETNQAKVWDE